MKIILFLTLVLAVCSRPSSYDLRVQPSIIKYADYSYKS